MNDSSTPEDAPAGERELQPQADPSAFRRRLAREFYLPEYREAYAEEHLKTFLASQISVMRQMRGMSQTDLATRTGTKQSSISRIENVHQSAWNVTTKTLSAIAFALGTRLKISLETFGTLIEEVEAFSRGNLERPGFEDDPLIKAWVVPQSTAIVKLDQADDPRAWMQRAVGSWLDQTDWQAQRTKLTNWLRGYGLPPVGSAEAPHAWLIYGLPLGPDRPARQLRFAELLAKFIGEQPDTEFRFEESEDALYNLFMLCAAMDWCELLADPLDEVLTRLRKKESSLSMRVRDALLAALIRTQIDPRHHDLWKEMLLRGTHDLLPGDEYAGFSGVKWMPETRETMGQPYVAAVVEGLKLMAEAHLASVPEKKRKLTFHDLIDQVLRLYNGDRKMVEAMAEQARFQQLPRWARIAIDELIPRKIVVQVSSGEVIEAYSSQDGSARYVPITKTPSTQEIVNRLYRHAPNVGGWSWRSLWGSVQTVLAMLAAQGIVKSGHRVVTSGDLAARQESAAPEDDLPADTDSEVKKQFDGFLLSTVKLEHDFAFRQ